MRTLMLTTAALICVGAAAHATDQRPVANPAVQITEADVLKAQKAWGEALVTIAKSHEDGGVTAAKRKAGEIIDQAYGYDLGPVLFKPTLTEAPATFRTTRDGALAYFVGDDPRFPQDKGFALQGWRAVSFENAAIVTHGDTGKSLAKVKITDKAGKVTEVDKTLVFRKEADGDIKIVVHHSSLPYRS
ncbi:hypothetical protein [Bosea thiooxidans]